MAKKLEACYPKFRSLAGETKVVDRMLTPERKALMAEGRRQTRIVERYLKELEQAKTSKANRVRTPESIEAEANEISQQLESAVGIDKLELLQRREDLQRLALETPFGKTPGLEDEFVDVAAAYGERKGISYSTWRECGVSKEVLASAGIARTRRPYRS